MARHAAPKRRNGGLRLLVLGTVLVTTSVVGFASPGAANSGLDVTFAPVHSLVDGQVVTVRITGAQPGETLYVRQCSETPTVAKDCSSPQSLIADSSGAGLLFYPIAVSIDSGHNIPGNPKLKCGVGTNCSLVVETLAQASDPSSGILQVVDFATADALCPTSGLTVVGAEGTAAYSQMASSVQPAICQVPHNVTLDFIASKGDSGARQDFLCGLRDVALTETPGNINDVCALDGSKRKFIYVPIANTSLVLAYKMRDRNTGQVIEDLKLTPNMISWLYTGLVPSLSSFSSSDIRATAIAELNSGHQLPRALTIVGRADASSLNLLFTRFLLNRAAEAWHTGGPNFDIQEPSEYYPAQSGLDLRSSGAAVAALVGTNDELEGLQGWIGVMDKPSADFYGLPTVAIGTSNDATSARYISATDDAVERALPLMLDAGQGTYGANVAPRDQDAYPLVVTIYAMVPTDTTVSAERASAITKWLAFQRDLSSVPSGYISLTSDQKTAITNAIEQVKGQPAPTPSPTPSATKSTNSSNAVSDSTDSGIVDVAPTEPQAEPSAVPIVSIFAASMQPVGGASAFLLPLMLLIGIATSVRGVLRLRPEGAK